MKENAADAKNDRKFMEWYDTMHNDPYERYREAPKGCRDTFFAVLAGLAIAMFLIFCVGCKSQAVPVTHDSVRVEFKHDSVYIFKHDSVFRDRWRAGDTVYVVTEKWQTLYRDQLKEIHDTIRTNEIRVQQVKYVPAYYKNTSTGFWLLLVVLLLIAGWKIGKYIIKIKTGGLL